jgi:hypothetical protein
VIPVTCGDYTRVLPTHCTRGCGCSGHPAFPTPSFEAGGSCTARAHRAAGSRTDILTSLRGAKRRSNAVFFVRKQAGLLRFARNDVQCLGCLKIESEIVPSMITRSSGTQTILLIILKANFVWSNHDRAFHGHMVRDARRCRAPHHEGLRPHPEEARSAVSKDEATELENALSRDRHRDRFCNKKFSAVEANTCMLASRSALPVSRVIAECSRPATAMQLWPAASP